MKLTSTILLGLLQVFSATVVAGSTGTQPKPVASLPHPKIKVSRGVYATEVAGPVLYESLSALTFEFTLPEWVPGKTLMYDQTCDTEDFSQQNPASTYTCPIYHHLHKIRDHLEPIIQLSDLKFPPTSSSTPYNIGDCEIITEHFQGVTVTEAELDSYVKQLSRCLDGRVIHNLGINTYNQSVTRLPYALMMTNFVENYFQHIPSEGRTDLAVLLNAVTSYNNLGLTQALAESQRWRNAFFDCKMQNIPTSLITPIIMAKSLSRLNETLNAKQLELALGPEAVEEYYTEKITDCAFTSRSLFVRVLLPTRRQSRVWKLVSVRSVPFRLQENGSTFICRVKEFDRPKIFMFDPISKDVVFNICDPAKTKFCRVQTDAPAIDDFKKSCASVVLGGESRRSKLARFCELHCDPIEDFHTPVFTRVAPDKFLIAGNYDETIVAQVDSQVNIIHPIEKGALEIILPCRGVLLHENLKLTVREPCGKVYRVLQVVPVHW